MYIEITDDDSLEEDFTIVEIGTSYNVVNTRECGVSLAYEFYDAEKVSAENIHVKINEVFAQIHEKVFNEVCNVLEDNGVDVD